MIGDLDAKDVSYYNTHYCGKEVVKLSEEKFKTFLQKFSGFGFCDPVKLTTLKVEGTYSSRNNWKLIYLSRGRARGKIYTPAKTMFLKGALRRMGIISTPEMYKLRVVASEVFDIRGSIVSVYYGNLFFSQVLRFWACDSGVWPVVMVPLIYAKLRSKDFNAAIEYSRAMNPVFTDKADMVIVEAMFKKLEKVL